MTVGTPTIHVRQGKAVGVRQRWTKEGGVTYVQADFSGDIVQNTYSINSATRYTVTNTTNLTVGTVITDVLVLSADWHTDGIGYNFDTVLASSLWADGGGHYRVEFVVTGASADDNAIFVVEVLVGDSLS